MANLAQRERVRGEESERAYACVCVSWLCALPFSAFPLLFAVLLTLPLPLQPRGPDLTRSRRDARDRSVTGPCFFRFAATLRKLTMHIGASRDVELHSFYVHQWPLQLYSLSPIHITRSGVANLL